MAHITHADSGEVNPNRPGKYAASAIDGLVHAMERAGAQRGRMLGAVVGGAEVSVSGGVGEDDALVLDSGTCRAVQYELQRSGIALGGTDVGGKEDRSVILDVAKGFVRVRTQSEEKIVCELSQVINRALAA